MKIRDGFIQLGLGFLLYASLASGAIAQGTNAQTGHWVVPRTPDGHPDLQGNWSNETLTPLERPEGQGPVMTPEAVARIERARQARFEAAQRPSDPNRPAPPVGGDGSTGAAGGVGGYNSIYIDAGERIAVVYGEPRTSLITFPADGQVPATTPAAQQRLAAIRQVNRQFDEYDNPENRPLGERCIISFGSNAGPPMLPNGFYNNNYTIVQTRDHVMIMTEMVHDVRIIRIGEPKPLPAHVRPWFGDSWGRWEGDTLVVETTNFHPLQRLRGIPSDNLKVIERFHRADENTIVYSFRVEDPTTYTEPWGGQIPMVKMNELLYEYACHEANYALFNILSGARSQEAKAEPIGSATQD
jgi:hypothetical protein